MKRAPKHLIVGSDEELEAKLDEGLASGPATVMTREEWDDIRREVDQRLRSQRTADSSGGDKPSSKALHA